MRSGQVAPSSAPSAERSCSAAERVVLEERQLPAVERLRQRRVGVGEAEAREQLRRERAAERVEARRLARRLRRRDRQHGTDAVRPPVERLEQHGARGQAAPPSRAAARRSRRRTPQGRRVARRRRRARSAARRRSSGRPRVRTRPEGGRSRPATGAECRASSPSRRGAQPDARREVERHADRQAHERCHRDVGPPLAEQGALELCVDTVERLVVPVEPAARLGGAQHEVEEHGPEEGIVGRRPRACVRPRVDRRGRLAV